MQNRVIAIGGLENAYMRKFTTYISKKTGGQARINIIENMQQIQEWDPDTVWIGSENFIEQVRSRVENPCCVILSEEDTPEEAVIFRYQSCEKICQKIAFYFQKNRKNLSVANGGRQKWIVITADSTVSQLLAFSLTLAYRIAAKKRVLYLNFSECSGMEELFLMEEGTDLSDLVLELRGDRMISLGAFVRQLEGIDCIFPPENPMILHEIRETDVEQLLQAVQNEEHYDYVVVMLGCTCCGCEKFFRIASAVFHLTREGESFRESRRAWLRLIHRCLGKQGESVTQVSVPAVSAEQPGVHLIYEWTGGTLGRLIEKYVDWEGEQE